MIVIGDVHGCYKTLLALIEKLPHDNLCFVGDLIDRGKYSKDVVELVKSKYKTVLGNHEDMMIRTMTEEDHIERSHLVQWWGSNGGYETLESYPKDQVLLVNHCEWFTTLPLYKEYINKKGQHFIISHSNINFVWNKRDSVPTEFKDRALWSRHFDKKEWGGSKIGNSINIIGHTIVPYIREVEDLIFIDTGCTYEVSSGYGRLSAYDLETGEVYQQPNIED